MSAEKSSQSGPWTVHWEYVVRRRGCDQGLLARGIKNKSIKRVLERVMELSSGVDNGGCCIDMPTS